MLKSFVTEDLTNITMMVKINEKISKTHTYQKYLYFSKLLSSFKPFKKNYKTTINFPDSLIIKIRGVKYLK